MSVSAPARKFKFLSKVSQQEVSEGSQPDNNHQTPHGPLVASLCLRLQIYLGVKNLLCRSAMYSWGSDY